MKPAYFLLLLTLLTAACKGTKTVETVTDDLAVGPEFSADSAYLYSKQQCDFGPRIMNSSAHDACRDWIVREFQRHGCSVELQQADLKGYDGTILHSSNIIAHYPAADLGQATPAAGNNTPAAGTNTPAPADLGQATPAHILLCAHYDSRPWADNDPDSNNHHTPVLAANDGASGVAVMLEVARLLHAADSAKVGVTFVCFDAEDYGTPQWYEGDSQVEDPWALGAQYWAQQQANTHQPSSNTPDWGILLDMVGGEGSRFYYEGMSLEYAKDYVHKVWSCASQAGYGSYFVCSQGGYITDDHVPVNKVAGIPCIDIIPYYPDCQQSSFGPTWHTVNDTMDHISKETLKAVGQTLIQVLYGNNQ